MKKQEYFPKERTRGSLGKNLNERKTSNLPEKELKVIFIKMLTKVERIEESNTVRPSTKRWEI